MSDLKQDRIAGAVQAMRETGYDCQHWPDDVMRPLAQAALFGAGGVWVSPWAWYPTVFLAGCSSGAILALIANRISL